MKSIAGIIQCIALASNLVVAMEVPQRDLSVSFRYYRSIQGISNHSLSVPAQCTVQQLQEGIESKFNLKPVYQRLIATKRVCQNGTLLEIMQLLEQSVALYSYCKDFGVPVVNTFGQVVRYMPPVLDLVYLPEFPYHPIIPLPSEFQEVIEKGKTVKKIDVTIPLNMPFTFLLSRPLPTQDGSSQ